MLPAAPTTLGAIQTLWNADLGLSTGGPGATPLVLFNDEVQEGTSIGTYFVLEDFDEDEPLLTSTGVRLYAATWVCVGYFGGTQVAEAAAALVRAAMNAKPLAVVGRNNVLMIETDYQVKLDETRSTVAQRVTEVRLSYRAQTQG